MHLRDSFRLKATSSLSPWLEDRASVCRLYSHRGAPAVLAQRGIPDFPICGQSGPRFPFPAESGNGGFPIPDSGRIAGESAGIPGLPVSRPNRESGGRELPVGISGSGAKSRIFRRSRPNRDRENPGYFPGRCQSGRDGAAGIGDFGVWPGLGPPHPSRQRPAVTVRCTHRRVVPPSPALAVHGRVPPTFTASDITVVQVGWTSEPGLAA